MRPERKLEILEVVNEARKIDDDVIQQLSKAEKRILAEVRNDVEVNDDA